VKYRVHEVAKDLGIPSKEIVQILTTYASAPKNHMQVLEDNELSAIFEYLTQKNQVDSLESIFSEAKEATSEKQPSNQQQKPAPTQSHQRQEPKDRTPRQPNKSPGKSERDKKAPTPQVTPSQSQTSANPALAFLKIRL
jgi:translation initiation factor IF-2